MKSYGTITEQKQPLKIEFSSSTANGASSVNTAGTITVTKTCDWASRASYTPALQSAYPTDSLYLLISAAQEQLPAGLCKITLTYQATSTATPDTTYVEQSSQENVSIQEHPDFEDWAADWDEENQRFKSGTSKYGITSYVKGTTTVTKTAYSTSKPSSERDSIGKLESPGGSYGSSANWLLIGANRSKQGAFWIMQKTYLYSAVAYNSDIYSAV
jgi:hypothetical protein